MDTNEHAHSINGVDGRMFARLPRDAAKGTFSTQTWKASREYKERQDLLRMTVELRFDDACGNGHNTFSATCGIDRYERGKFRDWGGGADHDAIARVFPELAPLLKWHLVSTDGPVHYLANTLYHAGDRDHNGLRVGERRVRSTNSGALMWELVAHIGDGAELRTPDKYIGQSVVPVYALDTLHAGEAPPATPTLAWQPLYEIGEGKARELDHARSTAVWPEATDAELMADDLRQVLEARLPMLLVEFRNAMESCGFAWASPVKNTSWG